MRKFSDTEQLAIVAMELNPFERPNDYIWDVHEKFSTRLLLCESEEEQIKESDSEQDKKRKEAALEMKDWLIRFFILFIDPESPFAKIRDFEARRKESLNVLTEIKGGLPRRVQKEINNRGAVYRLIQSEFYKLIYDHDYTLWASLCTAFETLTDRLRAPDTDTDEMVKITKQITDVKQALSELERKLFTDKRILRQVAEEKNNQMITGYAERFAKIFT